MFAVMEPVLRGALVTTRSSELSDMKFEGEHNPNTNSRGNRKSVNPVRTRYELLGEAPGIHNFISLTPLDSSPKRRLSTHVSSLIAQM